MTEHDRIFGQNFYSNKEPAWHKKGRVGQENEGAVLVYSKMSPVSFEQRPFTITLNGKPIETKKHFGIVRISNTEKVIGETKGRYKLVQPIRYAELFDEYVGKPVETFGFLGTSGEKMFITWNLPNVDVHGDEVKMYGFLTCGFDGRYGEKLFETGIRTVCWNTWNTAIADSEENHGGAIYAAKHNMVDHDERLGAWMRYMTLEADKNVQIYQGLFRKMEETPIGIDQAYNLFAKVYPKKDSIGSYYPDDLRTKDQTKIDKWNNSQEAKRDLAVELFKGRGIEITPTVWGAFNCITEQENHLLDSKKDTTESILIGNRQSIMQEALFVMKEYVN